ncbi:MAG: zinc-dependent alcohol dehydrogenase family protein [Calditrichota bacterium]
MKAMVLKEITNLDDSPKPLEMTELPDPVPKEKEILIKVSTCGVCHTELDEIEGRTPPTKFPIVLGHQVIGTVAKKGSGASRYNIGDRVGVAWIFSACGKCKFCREGNENLCKNFKATGRDANGGYAEYMTISEDFAYPIPSVFSDMDAAPLLCAGAVGYRSLRLTDLKNGQNLGFTGFGASGHLVISLARHKFPDSKMYVFARSGDERKFAEELGAVWAGDTAQESPQKLDAIIDTTPVWTPVVEGLKNLQPGGKLVINAIRKLEVDKNELTRLDYATHLWLEKEIKSVANVVRKDVDECLKLSAEIPLKPEYQEFPLQKANEALMELHQSKIRGAKVLRIS